MPEKNHKTIEVINKENLSSKFAIFILECDYDNKIYIGHTIARTIKTEIKKFINSILRNTSKDKAYLKNSIKNSQVLYITIKEPPEYTLDSLFELKYNTILNCCSYEPYGLNRINKSGNKCQEEKKYINWLLAKIGPLTTISPSNTKPVKEYELKNNTYREIAEWPSITAAAKHYNVKASNISACCTGRLNTAYGRVWKYSN